MAIGIWLLVGGAALLLLGRATSETNNEEIDSRKDPPKKDPLKKDPPKKDDPPKVDDWPYDKNMDPEERALALKVMNDPSTTIDELRAIEYAALNCRAGHGPHPIFAQKCSDRIDQIYESEM